MDSGGNVTVTPAGIEIGAEPICEAARDVEWSDLVMILDIFGLRFELLKVVCRIDKTQSKVI
jgi:hypothetical protein